MIKDMNNNTISEKELEKKLMNYDSYFYCHEIYLTALFLDKINLEKFEKEGKYWFIPRALIPIAYEAWWQLQHCVDSYGCDYEWIFSDEGMHDILVDQQQCDIHWWGETEEDFKDYFEL